MGKVAVGIDVAKELHWAQAIDTASAEILLNRRVQNDPASVAALIEELESLQGEHGRLRAGVDVLGGIAGLLSAMLLEADIEVVHVPGLAVNRARQGNAGGENKSDPRDAAASADLVARRRELRLVEAEAELDAEIRLLAGRRRELVVDQTRRVNRLRDLLASIHPGPEAVVDPTQRGSQRLLTRYVTPAEIRAAGRRRLVDHIARAGRLPRAHVERLADDALAAAQARRLLPAEAAGLAPVLTQSGKVRYLQPASAGNKALKRVFFQSAFCSLGHPASRAFYSRKRSEGERHHQAVISLARRRVDVLHAMLRNRTPYEVRTAKVA